MIRICKQFVSSQENEEDKHIHSREPFLFALSYYAMQTRTLDETQIAQPFPSLFKLFELTHLIISLGPSISIVADRRAINRWPQNYDPDSLCYIAGNNCKWKKSTRLLVTASCLQWRYQ